MGENNTGPLTPSLFRALTDKMYEKRKAAALELEKNIKECMANDDLKTMESILDFLSDLARSQNSNYRKGGLIGLAAIAIAAGRTAGNYIEKLVPPVLESFTDQDPRVRYYSCEALYNIIKITRDATLVYFNLLFDTLAQLIGDPEQNVRNGADLLDRSLKDIVTACPTFKISEFVSQLRERIYVKNSTTRRFLISWVQALYNVPQFNLVPYLPEILDGLFQILADETPRTREICEAILGEFLKAIVQRPAEADLQHMVNILIVHAQSSDDLVRLIALIWLREFLLLDGQNMLKSTSGCLTAILPCFSYTDEQKKAIRDTSISINDTLMKLICDEKDETDVRIDLHSVILILQESLKHPSVPTRMAVLHWIHHLYKKMPGKTFAFMEDIFPLLLALLPDPSDEVVLLDLEVLSDLCNTRDSGRHMSSSPVFHVSNVPPDAAKALHYLPPYFIKFMMSLLDIFHRDVKILMERGTFMIRQLCILLDADQIFRTLAVLLAEENDLQFASQMVQILNTILLTSPELFPLRSQLKNFSREKCIDLFVNLYKCWSNQPISLLALCLLTRNYEHAAQLVQLFGDLEVTVEFLTEIDKLIQLLESPIFTYLRLQLLDIKNQPYLATVLYGLLMLLPQTEAFHTLHRRLQCLPQAVVPAVPFIKNEIENGGANMAEHKIDFPALLAHFQEVQERHQAFRRKKHVELLTKQM